MPTTIGLENVEGVVYVQVQLSPTINHWYSKRIGEVFACRPYDDINWTVIDPLDASNQRFMIGRSHASVLPHAHVVAQPGCNLEKSIEYWKEVAGVVPGVPVSCARRETAELADRVTMIEKEIRPDASSPRGLPGSVVNRVTSLEADLCAHSIATRKADDDLAARIERLEHAHRGTVPVDALRRMIEWAWLHWSSQPRDRDRWTAVYAAIELWCPEIGHFTVDWESRRYSWTGKESA